jgi:tRNA G18 (ribose-2'-O)-methylase SpoU
MPAAATLWPFDARPGYLGKMPVERLATLDDPRLAPYRDLHQTNLTRGSGLFVVEGPLLVERLLASNYAVASVLVEERQVESVLPGVLPETPVYVVLAGQIERVIGFNFHRGVLACGKRTPSRALAEVLAKSSERFTLVVAVEVHDPGNLGGILRNSAAFGVDAVVLSPRCADPFSRRVLRVSMGAALRLAICESSDLLADLELLRRQDVSLLATVLSEEAERLETVVRPDRMALLLGNEAHGLPEGIVAPCDRRITLPMLRGTDSLNVAVASGIFLYELTR